MEIRPLEKNLEILQEIANMGVVAIDNNPCDDYIKILPKDDKEQSNYAIYALDEGANNTIVLQEEGHTKFELAVSEDLANYSYCINIDISLDKNNEIFDIGESLTLTPECDYFDDYDIGTTLYAEHLVLKNEVNNKRLNEIVNKFVPTLLPELAQKHGIKQNQTKNLMKNGNGQQSIH